MRLLVGWRFDRRRKQAMLPYASSPSSCHAPSPCRVARAFQECEEAWSEGEDDELSQAADGGIENGATASTSLPPFRRTCATPYSWNAEGTVSVSEVEDQFCRAYEEVVHWRKNIYPIPNGCSGKKFLRIKAKIV